MRIKTNSTGLERLGLSVKDVAASLGVSTRFVWKLVATGRLAKPIRLGRRRIFLRESLVAHLESLKD